MIEGETANAALENIRAQHRVMLDNERATMKDCLAEYHLHLYWPGLWHMHGAGQPYVSPFLTQKECMERAEELACQLGATGFVAHVHNESDKWKQEPVTNPKTGRLHMASAY